VLQEHVQDRVSPRLWISQIVSHAAVHYASPWEAVNTRLSNFVVGIHRLVGLEIGEFRPIWSWNHEDLAGNPLHFALLAVLTLSLFLWRKKEIRRVLSYALVVVGTFILFSILIEFNYYSMRLQLPLFVLGAPLLGAAFPLRKRGQIAGLAAAAFLLISLPWVLFNATRPIIGMRSGPEPWSIPCRLGCTRTGSVFFRSQADLVFANWPDLKDPITSIAARITAADCREVGLRIDSHDKEYLYWWALGAPSDERRIESIFTFAELTRYEDPSFQPCAVICTICGDRPEIHGLERIYSQGEHSLYLGGTFEEGLEP
jgi:hypothetical protein